MPGKEQVPGKEQDSGIHKTYERGPVCVTIDIDHKEITIADRLNVSIGVTVEEDYDLELPGFGAKLEQFGIVDYHISQPQLTADNKKHASHSYVLEPFLSGDYKIPPMTIRFWKNGEREKDRHEIKTEEFVIKVTSLLPDKTTDMKMHDIIPPVALPGTDVVWLWAAITGAIAVIMIAAAVILYRKRKAAASVPEQRTPPHEEAYRALEELVGQDLTGKGEIKLFYERISDILRRYIENRFGIRATDQTTEEFLISLKESGGLIKQYNSLLKDFLTGCDLVKFAEHQPQTEDIQHVFDACKAFIAGTADNPDTKE